MIGTPDLKERLKIKDGDVPVRVVKIVNAKTVRVKVLRSVGDYESGQRLRLHVSKLQRIAGPSRLTEKALKSSARAETLTDKKKRSKALKRAAGGKSDKKQTPAKPIPVPKASKLPVPADFFNLTTKTGDGDRLMIMDKLSADWNDLVCWSFKLRIGIHVKRQDLHPAPAVREAIIYLQSLKQ